jgi:NADH:ubiquinone oxidoreductase subunit K
MLGLAGTLALPGLYWQPRSQTAANCPGMTPLSSYLLLSALLFAVGLGGALTRRNAIIVLVGIELMLNAANLNFIAFWRFGPNPEALTGILFVMFSIGVAAAEAAVGLALVIAVYRHYRTTDLDRIDSLKG